MATSTTRHRKPPSLRARPPVPSGCSRTIRRSGLVRHCNRRRFRSSVGAVLRGPPISGVGSISLAELRKSGPVEAARQALRNVPTSSSILLHFDIDVLAKQDLPAAYFPHPQGLSLAEAWQLLSVLARDPRIRIIEISEYASLRDLDREYVGKLIDLLAASLGSSHT